MALTDESSGIPATMLVSPSNAGASNGGFGSWGDGAWIILLMIVLLAGNGWGNNASNGFGGGAPIIMTDNNGGSVQRGFDQAAIMSGIAGVQSGVQGIATQLCNGFAGVNATVNSGINTIAQQMYANTIADMERSFAAQTASTQGMTALQAQMAQCCCDNRAGLADLRYTVATEACADRQAVNDALRDVIAANTASTQRILDQLCQDKIDAKNDTIAQLRSQINELSRTASQNAQTAAIIANNEAQTSALEQYLAPVPRPAYIVANPNCCATNTCGCGVA